MAEADTTSTRPLQKVNFGGIAAKAAKAGKLKSIKLKLKFDTGAKKRKKNG